MQKSRLGIIVTLKAIYGWLVRNAGANIATESNEACIDIKNPGKNSWDEVFRPQWYWFRARSKYQVSFIHMRILMLR